MTQNFSSHKLFRYGVLVPITLKIFLLIFPCTNLSLLQAYLVQVSPLSPDTIYAEGTRRYLNALATYTRRRIKQVGRSDVDEVEYLPSTIALRQRPETPSVRSTVGTLTETLNSLRLIF